MSDETQTTLFDMLREQERRHAAKDELTDEADTPVKQLFLRFHDMNPEVFDKFCEFTLLAIREKHFHHYGSMGIIQQIRWDTGVTSKWPTGFKIDNNWSPFYSRMFEAVYPEYRGFFRMRNSVAD